MKRGLYRTSAVILNSFDFGESDRLLSFSTESFGKVKGVARGARRSRKRFVGNLEPLSHIRLIFFQSEKSELVRVEDATLIEGFHGLRADIDRLSEACYLLELVSEMTREGQTLAPVYGLLLDFLRMLDGAAASAETGTAGTLLRFFEVRLLSILGYQPHLSGCVVCRGNETDDAGARKFSSEKGGLVCRRCSAGAAGLIDVSPGTARFLSTALRFGSKKLTRLKPNAIFLEESERLLYDFIRHQIGKELKTKRFMDKMKNASV